MPEATCGFMQKIDPIPELVSSKIRCPKCNEKMELYGITEKAMWKYCCKNCSTTIESVERG